MHTCSPEDFGDSLKAAQLAILSKERLYAFQHLPWVNRPHRHWCNWERQTRALHTHITLNTPTLPAQSMKQRSVLGGRVKSHDWGRPSVALWGVIQLPLHRAVKRHERIRSLLSALTGMLNVFWEELIGTKLAKGSFRADSIPQPRLAFWTIVSKKRKSDTCLMQLSQVRTKHYFRLQTSTSPKTTQQTQEKKEASRCDRTEDTVVAIWTVTKYFPKLYPSSKTNHYLLLSLYQ